MLIETRPAPAGTPGFLSAWNSRPRSMDQVSSRLAMRTIRQVMNQRRVNPCRMTGGACPLLLLVTLGSLSAACFEPRYPQGIPCSEARTCPPSQSCDVDGICRVSPLPPPAPDASAQPIPDARLSDANPGCRQDEECPDGLSCNADGACIAPACDDGAHNGNETDMDCGGDCPGCALGRACETGLDCESGACTDRVCTEPPPGCEVCDDNAACVEPGSAQPCQCRSGYQGDGFTCADIDECALGVDDCGANANCTNTGGAFSCACDPGYYGDGIICAPPVSCAELLALDPGAATGVHRIDPDHDGPIAAFEVFCDMATAGGGWTVVEKSPFGNAIGRALYLDVPVNAASPGNARHRLPRSQIQALIAISTDMRIDCRGDDRLVTAAQNLFNGEGGPSNCNNHTQVLYNEASLKGHLQRDIIMCSWHVGTQEGCAGAWHIDEHAQTSYCGLPNYPWTGSPITVGSGDSFATDPNTPDPGSECHQSGATRFVMLR